MGNMNIHMRTGPKYEYSYNLANLRENWAQKKNRSLGTRLRGLTSAAHGWYRAGMVSSRSSGQGLCCAHHQGKALRLAAYI